MVETIVKQQVVNPYVAEWAHLKNNQYCTLHVTSWGTHEWRDSNWQLHRVDEAGHQDGPAYIEADGYQSWFLDGLNHRVGGPAVFYPVGCSLLHPDGEQRHWYLNGKVHRLDGPAIIYASGNQEWYLDGKWVTQEEWAQDIRVIEYHSQTQEGAEQWLQNL